MLKLTLFRHGKSDWDADFAQDIDRPLAKRGTRAARQMGEFLALSGQAPQLALTSPARRARDTLSLAHREGAWGCETRVEQALYGADTGQVLNLLHQLDDKAKSVLLTGHEPTWSILTADLIGKDGNIRFPTAAMARIDFALDAWSEVIPGSGELRWLVPPKLLSPLLWNHRND